MATRTRLTADDLWRMGTGDVRRELVDGEVIEITPAGGVHGRISGRVYKRLADHVEGHGGGEVLVGDVGFVLALPGDPERVRAPDVAFVSTGRLSGGRLPREFLRGAPDLAVESRQPSAPAPAEPSRDFTPGLRRKARGSSPDGGFHSVQ
jgi:Uma2 family endonuclease